MTAAAVWELAVLGDLVRPIPEAVDVHCQGNSRMALEPMLVAAHGAGEAVDDEQLLRELAPAHDPRER
jgi:hypothetical protein